MVVTHEALDTIVPFVFQSLGRRCLPWEASRNYLARIFWATAIRIVTIKLPAIILGTWIVGSRSGPSDPGARPVQDSTAALEKPT